MPDANFHGQAGFAYTVTDTWGVSHSAWATLEIEAVNDAPIATGDSAQGDEDHELRFTSASLLANDLDVD